MTRERMSSVDAAWLRMDDATHAMMITSLFRFDGRLDPGRFESLVRERMLRHPRFRQRVVEASVGMPWWEEAPHFDLTEHLIRAELPEPKNERALEALVSELASTSLDRDKPLWQFHLVDAPRGTALIARLHHAIGDGISLIHFLLSLTDECANEVPREVGLQLGTFPHAFADAVRMAADHAATLARLTTLPTDPPTRLRGEVSGRRRAAYSPAIPMATLKRCASTASAKLNDVLLALVGGAVRRYLLDRGDVVDDLELRALVPVFFRGHGDTEGLGNHFGLVFAPILVGIPDPKDRLAEVKRRMDALKGASDAIVSLEVLEAMGLGGAGVERIGIDIFTRKASAMITNVPGPPATLHLAGAKLADMMVWAPVSGHLGIGISFLSYDGHLRAAVLADERRMPDPSLLVDAFVLELAALDS